MSGLLSKLPIKRNTNTNVDSIENTDSTHNADTESHIYETTAFKPVSNRLTKMLAVTKYLPASTRASLLSKTFGKIVPYVGTTGLYYETVEPNQVVVSLNNNKNIRNHIGSIHAVAVTLLAETATGFILGVNLPADRILLIKSYSVDFYRPLQKGQVAAIATLSDEQRLEIINTPKGEMVIPCVIEDRDSDSERAPITVEMTWAWIPKAELDARRAGNQSKQITNTSTDIADA